MCVGRLNWRSESSGSASCGRSHVARPLQPAVGGSLWSGESALVNPYGVTEQEADPLHVDCPCATVASVETAIPVALSSPY